MSKLGNELYATVATLITALARSPIEGILRLVIKIAALFYAADQGQREMMISVSTHGTDD
jgi:hypothetical protein